MLHFRLCDRSGENVTKYPIFTMYQFSLFVSAADQVSLIWDNTGLRPVNTTLINVYTAMRAIELFRYAHRSVSLTVDVTKVQHARPSYK